MYDDNYNRNEAYESSAVSLNAFMTKVFGWLFAGLMLTAASSFVFIAMLTDENSLAFGLFANPVFFIAMVIIELVLVVSLSRSLQKIMRRAEKISFLYLTQREKYYIMEAWRTE